MNSATRALVCWFIHQPAPTATTTTAASAVTAVFMWAATLLIGVTLAWASVLSSPSVRASRVKWT